MSKPYNLLFEHSVCFFSSDDPVFQFITIFAIKIVQMEYTQDDISPTLAAEAALEYDSIVESVTFSEIERDCLSLEESKRLVLDMVHRHFHPVS